MFVIDHKETVSWFNTISSGIHTSLGSYRLNTVWSYLRYPDQLVVVYQYWAGIQCGLTSGIQTSLWSYQYWAGIHYTVWSHLRYPDQLVVVPVLLHPQVGGHDLVPQVLQNKFSCTVYYSSEYTLTVQSTLWTKSVLLQHVPMYSAMMVFMEFENLVTHSR